ERHRLQHSSALDGGGHHPLTQLVAGQKRRPLGRRSATNCGLCLSESQVGSQATPDHPNSDVCCSTAAETQVSAESVSPIARCAFAKSRFETLPSGFRMRISSIMVCARSR